MTSSWIQSVSHDGSNAVVSLKSGNTYAFAGVSANQVAEWNGASSAGSYYNRNIRGNYSAEKR